MNDITLIMHNVNIRHVQTPSNNLHKSAGHWPLVNKSKITELNVGTDHWEMKFSPMDEMREVPLPGARSVPLTDDS